MSERVNVVIATFRRPERLTEALSSLVQAAARTPAGWAVGVTVVDDDPTGSAQQVAARFGDAFELGCAYVSCGSRNISQARNTGYEAALPLAEWVASIDDDVVVPPTWFETCVLAVSGDRFNAVTGPLTKDFSNGPAYLSEQPFGELGILAGRDGAPAFVCATGNNWMSSSFLRERPSLRFSLELGETGGEDMDFFYRAVEAGLRPMFSSRAAVLEVEPPSRCTLRYQVRRAFWLGVSESQVSLRQGLAGRGRLIARALRRVANGGARTLSPQARQRRGRRFAIAIAAQSLGTIVGSVGFTLRHK